MLIPLTLWGGILVLWAVGAALPIVAGAVVLAIVIGLAGWVSSLFERDVPPEASTIPFGVPEEARYLWVLFEDPEYPHHSDEVRKAIAEFPELLDCGADRFIWSAYDSVAAQEAAMEKLIRKEEEWGGDRKKYDEPPDVITFPA